MTRSGATFADAAAEYERTAYDYPKNAKSATAGYAALVAYQKHQDELSGAAQSAWHAKATAAGIKFAETFPEHPDSAGVLTRAAEDEFAAKDLPRATELAQLLLARQPPVDANKQRIAWTIIAESQFSSGTYDQAEAAFLKARELSGSDAKQKNELSERVAADVYKQAEAKPPAPSTTTCAWRRSRRTPKSAPPPNTMPPRSSSI